MLLQEKQSIIITTNLYNQIHIDKFNYYLYKTQIEVIFKFSKDFFDSEI